MGGRRPLAEAEAWDLLAQAPEIRVAALDDGQPMLRTMHAAVQGRSLVLHGTPRGSKSVWAGSAAVASAETVVARVPSWMRHPEKACPATTYYRSVQVQGRIVPVADPEARARALSALMAQLQPEGGHRPIDADDPLYRAGIRGLGVWALVVDRITGIESLGQHLRRAEMEGILQGLWRRGAPGDLAAVEILSAAHPERPAFAPVPSGTRPRCHPDDDDVRASVALVRDAYWNTTFTDAVLGAAMAGSAWVGIAGPEGLVATARGISDTAKRGWIYDVAVAPDHQGRGVGTALMGLILDHPRMRGVQQTWLTTRDAMGFYGGLGFEAVRTDTSGPSPRTDMVRMRSL